MRSCQLDTVPCRHELFADDIKPVGSCTSDTRLLHRGSTEVDVSEYGSRNGSSSEEDRFRHRVAEYRLVVDTSEVVSVSVGDVAPMSNSTPGGLRRVRWLCGPLLPAALRARPDGVSLADVDDHVTAYHDGVPVGFGEGHRHAVLSPIDIASGSSTSSPSGSRFGPFGDHHVGVDRPGIAGRHGRERPCGRSGSAEIAAVAPPGGGVRTVRG